MSKVVIIGCGIIGASIAYELSTLKGLKVTLIDEKVPAFGATGAALGVLMGVISHKTKGRAWKLRQTSLERYETLIPELESLTGITIPFNRQGIVMLCLAQEDDRHWEDLAQIRHSQGLSLERWDRSQLQKYCPQIENKRVTGAIYSPHDRQVNPTILTQALVAGASQNGVDCQFGVKVQGFTQNGFHLKINTINGVITADWLIICAGMGSNSLNQDLSNTLTMRPVLGQALQLQLDHLLGNADFQPVISGEDVHIVPSGKGEYWVGATVEFPNEQGGVLADPQLLEKVRETAIAVCPQLAQAKIVRTWFGKRPRPEGKAAPVIEQLPNYNNVLLATGHYRNGVLLAPATAQIIRDWIIYQK